MNNIVTIKINPPEKNPYIEHKNKPIGFFKEIVSSLHPAESISPLFVSISAAYLKYDINNPCSDKAFYDELDELVSSGIVLDYKIDDIQTLCFQIPYKDC